VAFPEALDGVSGAALVLAAAGIVVVGSSTTLVVSGTAWVEVGAVSCGVKEELNGLDEENCMPP
jgi:hypothetical protein